MDWRLPDQPHAESHDRGTLSEAAPVTSGVPQGSALVPLLFLCDINDLPVCVSSHIRLFADDAWSTINAQHITVILQEDLNMLQQWEAKWLMFLTLTNVRYLE